MTWVAAVADWATLLAAAIAIVGVVSIWLARPRVAIDARDHGGGSGSVHVSHKKGTAPIKALHYAIIGLDESGTPFFGDGLMLWVPELVEGGRALLRMDDSGDPDGDQRPNVEHRAHLHNAPAILVGLSWQHAFVSWRRSYALVRWSRGDVEDEGQRVVVVSGRRAKREWLEISRY